MFTSKTSTKLAQRIAGALALVGALVLASPQPALAEGWYQRDGSWRYEDASGQDATGWLRWNDTWYYLQPDGNMRTGWLHWNGSWYWLGSSGAMKTGWVDSDGWYLMDPSGAMQTGWQWVGASCYYLNESHDGTFGLMYASRWTPDKYWVGPSGAWVDGIREDVKPSNLTIIHTNDVHGHCAAAEGCAGMAAVAALKKDELAKGGDVLLFDAGDNMQGSALVNLSNGLNSILFMNAAGYDAMCVGNHDFDYGQDNLKEKMGIATFKVLTANVLYEEDGTPLCETSEVFELKDGSKLGIFGLTTPDAKTTCAPRNTKGLKFAAGEELYACAQQQIDALRAAGCDLVVCLGHIAEEDPNEVNNARNIIAHTSGLDLFIDAHDHEVESARYDDLYGVSVPVQETGCFLANIGVVRYGIDGQEPTFNAELIPASSGLREDEATKAVVDAAVEELEKQMGVKVGSTPFYLNGERAPGNRTTETNLGDLTADALLWQARQVATRKVDGAIVNGGGVRASVKEGDITLKDIRDVFPFDNALCIVSVTGAQLLEALEAGTYCTPEQIGAFPQVAGIEYEINTQVPYEKGEQYPGSTYYAPAKPGSRVTIKSVDGQPWSATDTYTIAASSFICEGGDTYYAFKAAAEQNLETLDIEDWAALKNYLVDGLGGVVPDRYAEPQGRIVIK